MNKKRAVRFLVAAFLLWCGPAGFAAGSIVYRAPSTNLTVPQEVLVKFKSGVSADQIQNFLSLNRLESRHVFSAISLYHLRSTVEVSVAALVNQLKSSALVEYVQPNYRVSALGCPAANYSYTPLGSVDDTNYKTNQVQWNIHAVRADDAWMAYGTTVAQGNPASGTIIAIMDTGLDSAHLDLQWLTDAGTTAKIVPGVSFVPGAPTTDDDNNTSDTGSYIGGHGTHCAGVAAAQTNNTRGIAGVAGNCRIMPIKVLDQYGSGTSDTIIPGFIYAADHGAKVISCSLGGGMTSQAEQDAINYAHNRGCLIVAATGNDGQGTISYPAGYANVMAVGATDGCDQLTWYSNYGNGISVVAPGGANDLDISGNVICSHNIISTCNEYAGPDTCLLLLGPNDNYSALAGTSFATPMAAGLAGVLFSLKPGAIPEEIQGVIERTADPVDGGTQGIWNARTGYGRINVLRAVGYIEGDISKSNSAPFGNRSYNFPNPFSPEKQGYTTIVFNAEHVDEVKIKIFDAGGTPVWETTIPATQVSTNWYNFVKWDGKNSNGQAVANGVYFYRITGGGLALTKKIAVLR